MIASSSSASSKNSNSLAKTDNTNLGNILTLQTFTDTGEFLVESLNTNKFMLPGELDYPNFYNQFQNDPDKDLKFILTFTRKEEVGSNWVTKPIHQQNYIQPISIECYPRTNVI